MTGPSTYVSAAAVAAAQRMSATGIVGDPACSLSASGTPDPSLVPPGVPIGIGQAGGYTCLIW
jgi:hypothetical protein